MCLYLLKGKLAPALLKKVRPVLRMYFVMLHQKDSMCNGVWFLVCLPPRVNLPHFQTGLRIILFSQHLCTLTEYCNLLWFKLFLVCQSLVSHLGNCVPAHCSRVASLLIKRALGSLISSCWWGRHLCHPTHSASSAVSESCKVKMSPTISLGISFLIIWPITSFPKGNSLISKLADWCNMSRCTGDGTGWSGWLNAFQL